MPCIFNAKMPILLKPKIVKSVTKDLQSPVSTFQNQFKFIFQQTIYMAL